MNRPTNNRIHKTAKGTELPILNLRGKDYLEVKYRIVWFREEHPDWSIETEFVSVGDKSATAKAIIRDSQGRVISTGHKFENERGFPDFMEKAETGAIGRALALIGYGTQFCADELDEGERIVDAPVGAPAHHPPQETSQTQPASSGAGHLPDEATEEAEPVAAGQMGVGRGKPMPSGELGEFVVPFGKKFKGKKLKEIPRRDIESYVAWLEADAAKKNTPLSYEVKMLKYAVERYFETAA